MTTEVLNPTHPHDPRSEDLTWEQAEDVLRYFTPPGQRLHFHRSGLGSVHIFRGSTILSWGIATATMGCHEEALRKAGLWPETPPPPRFVNIGPSVMQGAEAICLARSNTMAKRIAAALNWYKPGRRGS